MGNPPTKDYYQRTLAFTIDINPGPLMDADGALMEWRSGELMHEPYVQPSSPLRCKLLFGPLVLVIQSPLAQLAIADRLKQLFAVDLLGRQF